jgi:hypothetical protein
MNGLTLGHFLYFAAAGELVAVFLIGRSLRARPEVAPQSVYVIVAAGVAAAIMLCGIATFAEVGRIPIS